MWHESSEHMCLEVTSGRPLPQWSHFTDASFWRQEAQTPALRSASEVHAKHHKASLPSLAPEAIREDSQPGHTGAARSTFTSPHDAHPRELLQDLQMPFTTSTALLQTEHVFWRARLRCSYSSGNLAEKHALQKPLNPDCAATRCRFGWSPAHQPAFGVSTRGMRKVLSGLRKDVSQTLTTNDVEHYGCTGHSVLI